MSCSKYLEGPRALFAFPEVHLHVDNVLGAAKREFDAARAAVRSDVLGARPPGLDILLSDVVVSKLGQAAIVPAADVAAVLPEALVPGSGGYGNGRLGPGLDVRGVLLQRTGLLVANASKIDSERLYGRLS